ncbi:MAG: hypothetical protein AB7T31_00255 [Gemmatimonadales bacterium]
MRAVIRVVSLILMALLCPPGSSAQQRDATGDSGALRAEGGVSGLLALPIGEFSHYVRAGGGLRAHGVAYLDGRGMAGIRLDGSWIVYGSRTVRRQLSPTIPFVDVDVTTSNWIASLGLGPQLALTRGRVRPYLHGSVGFSYFATTTSVEGSHDDEPFASSTNFEDFTFALLGGGGMQLGLAEAAEHPISLDLGVDFVRHGLTEYLREGGLREGPGGGVFIEAIRSRTSLSVVHLGVTVGVR